MHRRYLLRCVFFALAMLWPLAASAQSIALGIGFGIPLMDYFTGQTGREYRVTPQPGYYPVLQTLENTFSADISVSLLLNFDLPVQLEVRFDMANMGWSTSRVTHVSCEPVDVVNGTFSDAATKYIALDDVDETCLNRTTYEAETDLSSEDRAMLRLFHISGGVRYPFYKNEKFQFYGGGHLGFSIATTFSEGPWFGADIDAILGIMYKMTEYLWIEFNVKLLFMAAQPPQDSQTRINHETQTGGNIFTSLVQPDAYIDFQLALRFDFSTL
ncbi:MAG: hypothetical protein II180_08795 [Proteobacteria bacterium]|nr:hypothetical protein [Pseudomonadota bacterium]